MTNVAVAGAFGLLGSTLVPYLRAGGHDVHALGRGIGGFTGDLSDREQSFAVLDAAEPSVIVNLAALADVDACERNPHRAYLGNVRIVENLVAWIASRGNHSYLVHLSTDQVYDGDGTHAEGDVTLTNHYAVSKYAGELAAARVASTVLRTNFFGPSRHPSRLSLSDWLVRTLGEGMPATVFEDVQFSPLSMSCVAKHVQRAVMLRRPGVFNLGSRDGLSKADFAFALATAMQLPTGLLTRGRSTDVARAAYRPTGMRMDSSLFEQTFETSLPALQQEIESATHEYAVHAT